MNALQGGSDTRGGLRYILYLKDSPDEDCLFDKGYFCFNLFLSGALS